jgi:DUF4097 and DUF4098 domain-containing protein YvlB
MAAVRNLRTGVVLIICSALSGCGFQVAAVTAEEEIAKTFPVTATTQLVVETFNGSIDVTTHPKDQVDARVIKQAGGTTQEEAEANLQKIDVAIAQEGNAVRITARMIGKQSMSNSGARVEVQVPAGSVLDLRTTNGKVEAIGPLGEISAHSTNGAIEAKGGRGTMHLTTTNGPIRVDGGTGRLGLETTNGAMQIRSDKAVVDAATSNGAIHFTGKLIEGNYSFRTSNGAIDLTLPDDARFVFDAETSNGHVQSDFGMSRKEAGSKNHLRGAVGAEPATDVKLRTSNGSIRIHQGSKSL